MMSLLSKPARLCAVVLTVFVSAAAHAQVAKNVASKSPWGEGDEIGALNMMSDASRLDAMSRIASGKVYDLAVDLFAGMPDCCSEAFGDPAFQNWVIHAPARGDSEALLSHFGDAVSMSTHTGTHIDALSHFGLHGKIWNEVDVNDAHSVRGWAKSGADKYPPVIARGVLLDVAGVKGVKRLPASYAITVKDLKAAAKRQGVVIEPGDVVLVRTGVMTDWPNKAKLRLFEQPGLSLEAAQWLVEGKKAMLLGGDNFGLERFPSDNPQNFAPMHSYLLAEKGVSFMEVMWLEELAKDEVFEFLFIASPLKLRGATGSPIRPIAIPINSAG